VLKSAPAFINPGRAVVGATAAFRQLPFEALFEPRATIPSCSISAIRKLVATGSSILREQLLRSSLCGGCSESMCCSAPSVSVSKIALIRQWFATFPLKAIAPKTPSGRTWRYRKYFADNRAISVIKGSGLASLAGATCDSRAKRPV
jgi:hypothetical protein